MKRLLKFTHRLALLGLMLVGAGCATSPFADQRVTPYAPDLAAAERMPWQAPDDATAVVTTDPAGAPATNSSGSPTRTLRRDDRVMMSLRGIPRPEEVTDVVDGQGRVKLPHIGGIRVEGLTSADAEEVIEKAYVDQGIYTSINVILVAQEDAFFVQGEATRPGKYPLAGDTSVLLAISAAGGYTDYGNPRKIRVIRGDKVFNLNAERIEQRADDDFLIESNDIIIIERKILF